MCGIYGIMMTEDSKAREEWSPTEMAQLMFPAIRHRGPHAFGWMAWNGPELNELEIVKGEGDIGLRANLATVEVDDRALWMVGHVRYATHGSTSNMNNNHPVSHGSVVGVHNGVLSNHERILEKTGREPDTEVDSEAIFAAVNKWGHRPGLRRLEGSMVTVYTRLDKLAHLWLARTEGRPLVLARTPAGSIVFASELGVLEAVWGDTLTHVRELRRHQLLRLCDGKVAEQDRIRTKPKTVPLRPATQRQVFCVPPRVYDGIHGITDRMSKPVLRDPEDMDLYWHQGKLLDEAEYLSALETEMEEGWS